MDANAFVWIRRPVLIIILMARQVIAPAVYNLNSNFRLCEANATIEPRSFKFDIQSRTFKIRLFCHSFSSPPDHIGHNQSRKLPLIIAIATQTATQQIPDFFTSTIDPFR